MRPIDADSLLDKILKMYGYCRDVESLIRYEPTIDAVPVAHGKWVREVTKFYSCSECGKTELMSPYFLKKYCPHCGTKMDLE